MNKRNLQRGRIGQLPGLFRHTPLLCRAGCPLCPLSAEWVSKIFSGDALSNGTLFPGLNLPFHLKVEGSTLPSNPLVELQALEFVVLELGIYLDTHPEDMEAFQLFQQYAAMEKSPPRRPMKSGSGR